MKDIIFHVGHPKCASTTLQNKVFINEPGYLGTAKGMKDNYAKKLQRISPVGPSISYSKSKAKQWAAEVQDYANQHFPYANNLIASSEMYANSNKIKERPIIPFLKHFADNVWTNGSVKVVMIIRNQFNKIASGYAQVSNQNMKASQADFKRHIKAFIDKNNQHLMYDIWVKELNQALGNENVCVLLMEDIQSEKFWHQLKNFCKLDSFDVNSMITEDSNSDSNSNKSTKNTWTLKDFNPELKANVMVNNFFGLLWPSSLIPTLRNSSQLKLKQSLNQHYSNKAKALEQTGNQEIELTKELKTQLVDYYKSSNVELGRLLNRDLSELGYY